MNLTAYIIEILCKPASSSSKRSACHASVCAIAESPEAAENIAIELVMSHGYISESVELVW